MSQPLKQSGKLLTAILLSLLSFSLFAAHPALLPAHQSRYSVHAYGSHVGELHNRLEITEQQINYTSSITATGLASMFLGKKATESSVLNTTPGQHSKYPLQQSYNLYRGKKHKKNQHMTFSKVKAGGFQIDGKYKKKNYSLSTPIALWSRHVIPLLMSRDLQLDANTTHATLHITDKGNINTYTYTLEKSASIKFNGENFPVLKFMIQKQGSNRMSYVWLSKAHYYLPLKIEQYKKGELKGHMQLKNISFTHKATKND